MVVSSLVGFSTTSKYDRLRGDDELLVLRDVDREVRELAGLGEVEEVVDRAACGTARDRARRSASYWPLATGDRADRQLQQHRELLPRRSRVRDDDLAAVDGVDDELAGDELVVLLAVLFAEAVAVAVEVLADEDGQLPPACRRPVGLLRGRRSTGCRASSVILPSSNCDVVLRRPRTAGRARRERTSSR